MKKKKWTKVEVVDWLKKRVALGECEPAAERYLSNSRPMAYAAELSAKVDPQTKELIGFTIDPVDLSEREQSFKVELEWGICTATGLPDRALEWVTDPPLSMDGFTGDAERLELDYQALLNAYLEPEWFHPSEAWCPEDCDDLPGGRMEVDDALDNLPSGTRYFVDREGGSLYLPCEEKDVKRLLRKKPNVEEVSADEACSFVAEHFGDRYDWPMEDDFTPYDPAEDLPDIPLHSSEFFSAEEKFRGDKFWREIYRRAPVRVHPYLKLLFFRAANPELAGERRAFFQELIHEAESVMRPRDWDWLCRKTAERVGDLGMTLDEFCHAKGS